jgi:sugar phosphate isomerase/epimerase
MDFDVHFKPVVPRLRGSFPDAPVRLGMHFKSFAYSPLIRRAGLSASQGGPLNLLEVKPEEFRGAETLFTLQGERFRPTPANVERLVAEASALGMDVQFHFPTSLEGADLNPGDPAKHDLILSLFEAIEETIGQYHLQPNVTLHPPVLTWGGRELLPRELHGQALTSMNDFLRKLALESWAGRGNLVVGVENQADPKTDSHCLGYEVRQFATILAETPSWVNVTIDTGHRILTRGFKVKNILEYLASIGKSVVNFHFHQNHGLRTTSYKDDEHQLPVGGMIPGHYNYLRRAVQEGIPVVIEVNIRAENLQTYYETCTGIRQTLETMRAECWRGVSHG